MLKQKVFEIILINFMENASKFLTMETNYAKDNNFYHAMAV